MHISIDSMKLLALIKSYQSRGHEVADLDPLDMRQRLVPSELQLETYGFSEKDFDREFYLVGDDPIAVGFLSQGGPRRLGDLYEQLKRAYCGRIGVEYMHLAERALCNWIRERFEREHPRIFAPDEKRAILRRLIDSSQLERFLAIRYGATKRFGLEGSETLLPGLKAFIDRSADLGVESVTFGMAHRGRLNVLANLFRKPLEAIFHEFEGGSHLHDAAELIGMGSGDVKYHLGTSYTRTTPSGKDIQLTLVANPSHLEAVNPVVLGKVKAQQIRDHDSTGSRHIPLLLHGDAAMAGQGSIYETMELINHSGFSTGGTVHVVLNNQIGFTTLPSTPYCTQVAKSARRTPIFHVNGADPEAVAFAMELAAEWRHEFRWDVVVDIIGYRKYGHSEIDDPKFTQPLMYKKIESCIPTVQLYADQLIREGVTTELEYKSMTDEIHKRFIEIGQNGKQYVPQLTDWSSEWDGVIPYGQKVSVPRETGMAMSKLMGIFSSIGSIPSSFDLHPFLQRQFKRRSQFNDSNQDVDWATAEMLALGSLLLSGTHVRVTGQDVERGTFGQRHAVLHDQTTGEKYIPLEHLSENQARFDIINSPLSEFAILGFEHGYTLHHPNALVIWEAQFGDFVNNAQVIIDQFISSSEHKWNRQSGLVLLLPHGYDGNGPEHSSARIERFLQLANSDPDVIPDLDDETSLQTQSSNLQIAFCTTPANYFHILRRQIHRKFRKPLILFTPKNLFKKSVCVSPLREFLEKTKFEKVLPDVQENVMSLTQISKAVICTGKIYYDLLEERNRRGDTDVALIRIEQLVPFPFKEIEDEISKYPSAEVIWCQEEPKNMGCWFWIGHHLKSALKAQCGKDFMPRYCGRPASAAPATGSKRRHDEEQAQILIDVFGPEKKTE